MLDRLLHRLVRTQEATLGVALPYLHHIADVARGALVPFGLFLPMARYRGALPPVARHVATLVATQAQDCGTCLQIAVRMAQADAMPPRLLAAVLDDRPEGLPPALALVYRYAWGVVRQQDEPALREALHGHYGEAALVDLAFALASAQVFPTVKRTLGYAVACSTVDLSLHPSPALADG